MELKYYLRGLGLGIVVTAIIMSLTTSKNRTMTDEEIISRAKQLGMTEERTLKDTAEDEEGTVEGEDNAGEPSEDGTDMDSSGGTDVSGDALSEEDPDAENAEDRTAGDSASNEDELHTESGMTAAAGENPGETSLPGAAQQSVGNNQTVLPDDREVGTENEPEPNVAHADDEKAESDDIKTAAARSDAPMVITIGNGDGSYAVSRKLADVGAVSSAENFDTFLCQNGYDKKIRTGTYTIPANASNEQMAKIITGAE